MYQIYPFEKFILIPNRMLFTSLQGQKLSDEELVKMIAEVDVDGDYLT